MDKEVQEIEKLKAEIIPYIMPYICYDLLSGITDQEEGLMARFSAKLATKLYELGYRKSLEDTKLRWVNEDNI